MFIFDLVGRSDLIQPSWSLGRNAKIEAELGFERRTAIINFWSKGGTPHQRVFNEDWHSGRAKPPVKGSPSYDILTRIGVGILGLVSSIIIGYDPLQKSSNGNNGRDAISGARHAAVQDSDGDDAAE